MAEEAFVGLDGMVTRHREQLKLIRDHEDRELSRKFESETIELKVALAQLYGKRINLIEQLHKTEKEVNRHETILDCHSQLHKDNLESLAAIRLAADTQHRDFFEKNRKEMLLLLQREHQQEEGPEQDEPEQEEPEHEPVQDPDQPMTDEVEAGQDDGEDGSHTAPGAGSPLPAIRIYNAGGAFVASLGPIGTKGKWVSRCLGMPVKRDIVFSHSRPPTPATAEGHLRNERRRRGGQVEGLHDPGCGPRAVAALHGLRRPRPCRLPSVHHGRCGRISALRQLRVGTV